LCNIFFVFAKRYLIGAVQFSNRPMLAARHSPVQRLGIVCGIVGYKRDPVIESHFPGDEFTGYEVTGSAGAGTPFQVPHII
jgi:hypothetical protein